MTHHNPKIPASIRSITSRCAGLLGVLLAPALSGCATTQDDLGIENPEVTKQALAGGLECSVIGSVDQFPPAATPNFCSNEAIGTMANVTARVIDSSVPEERRRFRWTINGGEVVERPGVYRPRSEDGCSSSECTIVVSSPCMDDRTFIFRVSIFDRADGTDALGPERDSATVTAVVRGSGDGFGMSCTPVPEVPPPTGGGGGGIGVTPDPGQCEIVLAEEICTNLPASPIVFDLGDVGYDLTNVNEGVRFDIDADGAPEKVSWTAVGADDAFLALDRNGNGQIDDGGELFGTATKLANGKTSAHGYIPLAELDFETNGGNGNGYVDEADRDFGTLLLWTDRNHDGRSSRDELRRLRDRGIFAIALHPDESDVVDEHGNRLAYVSPAYAWRGNRIQRIRTTDIFFWFREFAAQK